MSDIFFYGIDFKKIHLYAKFKIDTKEKSVKFYEYINGYKSISNIKLIYDFSKYYEVVIIDFYNEKLEIIVDCVKNYTRDKREDRIKIRLDFELVEFSYYFEETKESELQELNF